MGSVLCPCARVCVRVCACLDGCRYGGDECVV